MLAQIGRSAVAVVLGAEPAVFIKFAAMDSLSALFAVIAVLIVRNIDGIFEDQKEYLIRLEEQNK